MCFNLHDDVTDFEWIHQISREGHILFLQTNEFVHIMRGIVLQKKCYSSGSDLKGRFNTHKAEQPLQGIKEKEEDMRKDGNHIRTKLD